MALLRTSEGTLYRQLVDHLLSQIAGGALRPGDQLPTEQGLCDRFGVSRTTARRALDELRRVGVASRQPGRGSFVAELTLHAAMPYLHSFTDEIRRLGYVPGSTTLVRETVPADEEVARDLGLGPASSVLHLRRLRTADDQPIFVVDSFLNLARFPRLAELDLDVPSLYSLIEGQLGERIVRAEQWLSADTATERVAAELGMQAGDPVLAIRRITYVAGNIPIETVRASFHGRRYTNYVELVPPPLPIPLPRGRKPGAESGRELRNAEGGAT